MARLPHVSRSFIFAFAAETGGILQVTSCKGTSGNGSPLPTHQRTMTSFGKRITLDLPRGSLKAID